MTNHRSPMRGALIGFGNVAVHAHLPMWEKSKDFKIEAVIEPDSERAKLARALLPNVRFYSELGPLLADHDLDFVDICTPPCFHGDLIQEACRSGLHVFCEKPLVTCLESLGPIQQAADRSGRIIFTVNNWKYAPLWIKVFEIVREKRLGTIRSVSLHVLRPPGSGGGASNWRRCVEIAGGGILLDHGWHNLYLILSVLQEVPLSLSARMAYGGSDPLWEETADVIMRFQHAEGQIHLNCRGACRQNYGIIRGDRGTLSINDDHLVLSTDGEDVRYDFPEPLSLGSHHPEWMIPVMEDFHSEILDEGVRGANFRESRLCTHLTHLAYQSHREESPVYVRDLMV